MASINIIEAIYIYTIKKAVLADSTVTALLLKLSVLNHMAQVTAIHLITFIQFKALCYIYKIISTSFHTPAGRYFNLACKKYFRMHYRMR